MNKLRKSNDGKLFIVFDVLVGGTKVGEAETEYSVFNGILVGKLHELITISQAEHMKNMIASITPS